MKKNRDTSTDFLIPTRAKRARRCDSDANTLAGLLPELRRQIWDTLEDWADLAAVARVCKRLSIELRKHCLFVPRNWWPRTMRLHKGVRRAWFPSLDAHRAWIKVVQCAKDNDFHSLPPRLKTDVTCMDTRGFLHVKLEWRVREPGVGRWYLSVEYTVDSYSEDVSSSDDEEPTSHRFGVYACLFASDSHFGTNQPMEIVRAKLMELSSL